MLCGRDQRLTHFPLTQLAFCIACLTMTAWTWMRHSYALRFVAVPAEEMEVPGAVGEACQDPDTYPDLTDRYIVIRFPPRCDSPEDAEQFAAGEVHGRPAAICVDQGLVLFDDDGSTRQLGRLARRPDSELVVAGRMLSSGPGVYARFRIPDFDTTASRFHPASVAGIVVGAMGCFIFGLYLRAWLRERKALAGTPQQDMIA